MRKRSLPLRLVLLCIGLTLSAWVYLPASLADQRTISGTVTSDSDGEPLPGVSVINTSTGLGMVTNLNGKYSITVSADTDVIRFSYVGFSAQEIQVGTRSVIDIVMAEEASLLQETAIVGYSAGVLRRDMSSAVSSSNDHTQTQRNREGYAPIRERGFVKPQDEPLSTFSIDVDAASYSNVRRFITQGQGPPEDAVRIEEMINYFNYSYPEPSGNKPFSITTEIGPAPWAPQHKLLHVGLQGKTIPMDDLPASNLVFLIDVSGSMSAPNKLGLVKSSLTMLVNQLRPDDRVAIVVYAGAAGEVLPSTSGTDKKAILGALSRLNAGGSTAGGAGIDLAYKIAQDNFIEGGNNRIIMCTDGDFNVGTSSDGGLERLIEVKRNQGVFLTALGYGMGNYQDSKMEILADKGNGNYAYIDNALEAKKVLVTEFGGTLFTIAKDVKLQVEFNPQYVQGYRLIGYENRMLEAEDFNNDQKDAGELGSGHTVTAIYEIIPVGVNSEMMGSVDALKYQTPAAQASGTANGEIATVKFRYKAPQGLFSKLIIHPIQSENVDEPSENFLWSAAVAEWGMLLRESEFAKGASFESILTNAQASRGLDAEGYRSEFIRLVKTSQEITSLD